MQDALRTLVLALLLVLPAAAQGLDPEARLAVAIGTGDRTAVQKLLRQFPGAARARVGEGADKVPMLTYAIGLGANVGILQDLVDAGAEVQVREPKVLPPLHVAVSNGDLQAVQLLLARGANPNWRFQDMVPMHLALVLGSTARGAQAPPILKALLQAGASPDTTFPKDDQGRAASPLDFATYGGMTELVKVLKQFGAR